jgi:hypothetical protein
LRCSQACRQRSQACYRSSQACHRHSQACHRCSQTNRRCSQMLPGVSSALSGLSPALPGAPLVVIRPPICSQIFRWCSQVHLKAAASVQSTPGFAHPGIPVRQLPHTPRTEIHFADVCGNCKLITPRSIYI